MKILTNKASHKAGYQANHTLNRARRRQQRGNTLVPVVIGLGIAAVATVAFLNQGAELTGNNNANLAVNEITGHLGIYNMSRRTGRSIEDAINDIGITSAQINTYGNVTTSNATSITFPTDDKADCTSIANLMPDTLDGVNTYSCNQGSSLILTLD